MKLSTIFTSLVAAASTAAAVPAEASAAEIAKAEEQLAQVRAAGCNVGNCVAALAPIAAVCAAALAEPTPFGEATCLALIWNGHVNTPEACNGCV
ncbi:hypothetical protein VUR80DRAFT_8599 [Thermomyces stellatus]